MDSAPIEHSTATASTLGAREVWAFVRGGAPWALIAAVALGAAAFLQTSLAPPVYQADLALLVSNPRPTYGALPLVAPPAIAPGAYRSALVDGGVIVDAFARVLGREPSDAESERLLRTVRVSFEDQEVSSVLRVQVRHGSAPVAADVANAIAEGIVAWDLARSGAALARSVEALERAIVELDARIAAAPADLALVAERERRAAELNAARAATTSAVAVPAIAPLRAVAVPEMAIGPRPVFSTAVALVLGLVLGYAAWFLRFVSVRRVADADALEAWTGLPVLAAFPPRVRGAEGAAEDAAAVFRTRLAGAGAGAVPAVVLLTTPLRPSEKAGVAFGLAESLTRWGLDVLVVDADVRNAGASRELLGGGSDRGRIPAPNAADERGVAVALAGGRGYAFAGTAPRSHAAADAATRALAERVDGWAEAHDVVLLDAGPVAPFADTLALVGRANGVVLCVRHGATRRTEVVAALAALRAQGAHVLGSVLTEVPEVAAAFARARRVRPSRRG